MNTNAIRDVATKARRQLMEGVERRCLLYGIDEMAQRDLDNLGGRVLSSSERQQRRELLSLQDELRCDGKPGSGHVALVEQAAYTWFNRLFAIRFMELNDRLPSHVRMLSAQDGSFQPECLREALDLPLEALDRDEAARLVAEGDDEGLFRAILLAQCAELAECMPAVFERVGSAMELLLPDGLLAKDGVVESLVMGVPEDDWRESVEIVGWAYQFYVSERKTEFKKSKRKASKDDIAPATQLFTPEYIVRFLVQNSLGRLWVLNNPSSPLAVEMEYFVKPDPENHEDFRKIASPEEITLIDPACGSGHFLCYAFDLLADMYEECGYRRRGIPRLILESNLTGVEIDRRAAALTSFALTMKALEWDARFLRRGVAPKVICIESVELTPEEREAAGVRVEQQTLVDLLAHLSEVGSLWRPTPEDMATINEWLRQAQAEGGLFAGAAVEKLVRAQQFAQVLSGARLACITNPPYMRCSDIESAWFSDWLADQYYNEHADLCTVFIARGFSLTERLGLNAMVTLQNWMFLSSFTAMRKNLLNTRGIVTAAHLGPHGFDAITGEVVQTVATVFTSYDGGGESLFVRAVDGKSEQEKRETLLSSLAGQVPNYDFSIRISEFARIEGCPFSYWAAPSAIEAFADKTPLGNLMKPCAGLATGGNELFQRHWYEVSVSSIGFDATSTEETATRPERWYPCNTGGSPAKWVPDNDVIVDWEHDGERIRSHRNARGALAARPQNTTQYFKCGITWNKLSTRYFVPKFKDYGSIFDDTSRSGFPSEDIRLSLLGLLASSVTEYFLGLLNPSLSFTNSDLVRLPVVLKDEAVPQIERLVKSSIETALGDRKTRENLYAFSVHPLVRGNRISSTYGLWSTECKDRFDTLKANEEQLNTIFSSIYHLEDEVPIEVEDDKVSVRRADLSRDIRSLLSYAVGCMFGRYSLDRPGLVLANQGDGIPEYLAQVPHPRYMPDDDGILPITDDEYFDDDIVAMLCEWLRKAYGPETLEENLQFIANALGGTGVPRKVIRDYFMNQFFADHCGTYSVPSAGKRPIYWLVDSGKLGGFRALVYMHRYTPDLLARVRTDYVHERQERYRSRISELEDARSDASRREAAAIDKELKRLRAQLNEVTKFEERLHHLADQMIEIDLDDGFNVNYAKFADVMAKVK